MLAPDHFAGLLYASTASLVGLELVSHSMSLAGWPPGWGSCEVRMRVVCCAPDALGGQVRLASDRGLTSLGSVDPRTLSRAPEKLSP